MKFLMRLVLAVAVLLPMAAQASLTASISYFKIDSGDPDANHLCCSAAQPEVQNTLGPDGLPMLLSTYGGIMPHDVNGAHELTYWSPGFNTHVTSTGSATVSLPYSNSHMYNPNGSGGSDGGSNGFLSAIISATLSTPVAETVSFTIASDDNAFVFIDGQVVCNDGGVHGAAAVPCTSQLLGAGNHSLLLFYDDLNTIGAVLDFTVNTQNVSTTPPPANGVPEPASLALAAAALLMAGLAGRKTQR